MFFFPSTSEFIIDDGVDSVGNRAEEWHRKTAWELTAIECSFLCAREKSFQHIWHEENISKCQQNYIIYGYGSVFPLVHFIVRVFYAATSLCVTSSRLPLFSDLVVSSPDIEFTMLSPKGLGTFCYWFVGSVYTYFPPPIRFRLSTSIHWRWGRERERERWKFDRIMLVNFPSFADQRICFHNNSVKKRTRIYEICAKQIRRFRFDLRQNTEICDNIALMMCFTAGDRGKAGNSGWRTRQRHCEGI